MKEETRWNEDDSSAVNLKHRERQRKNTIEHYLLKLQLVYFKEGKEEPHIRNDTISITKHVHTTRVS